MATCDAGNGCSITCAGGCGAVWVEPNGPCYTFCDGAAAQPPQDVSRAERFSIDLHDVRISQLINVLPEVIDRDRQDQEQRGDKRLTLSLRSTTMRDLTAEVERHLG
jgi:hypothetical protein